MAVIAKQRYKLDIAPKGGWVIVYASQHDDGAREIEFEITNQGKTFLIPASINVSVQGIKANKSYFSHSCSYSGNIVTMALADDMTDVIGKAICVLKFTNSSQQKLATAKFILNVDSDSSSEGVIIDTEAEEIFNQMLNEIRAQAASVSADIAELQSMVGSPLVASTASAMTDHNKIYVYTGSESGYTNGNWYYWNGSAWTSGGVYNAVAVNIDSVPTQGSTNVISSGAAWQINKQLIDELSRSYTNPYESTFNVITGGVGTTGGNYDNHPERARTQYISVEAGKTYFVHLNTASYSFYNAWLYTTNSSSGASRNITLLDNQNLIFTVIGNESYFRVGFKNAQDATAEITEENRTTIHDALKFYNPKTEGIDAIPIQGSINAVSSGGVYNEIETVYSEINKTNARIIDEIGRTYANPYEPTFSVGTGGITSAGANYNNHPERARTSYVFIEPGKTYFIHLNTTSYVFHRPWLYSTNAYASATRMVELIDNQNLIFTATESENYFRVGFKNSVDDTQEITEENRTVIHDALKFYTADTDEIREDVDRHSSYINGLIDYPTVNWKAFPQTTGDDYVLSWRTGFWGNSNNANNSDTNGTIRFWSWIGKQREVIGTNYVEFIPPEEGYIMLKEFETTTSTELLGRYEIIEPTVINLHDTHIYRIYIFGLTGDIYSYLTEEFINSIGVRPIYSVKDINKAIRTGEFIRFTVKVNNTWSHTTVTDTGDHESGEEHDHLCILTLPESYTPNGAKTPLIMYCHGASCGITENSWYGNGTGEGTAGNFLSMVRAFTAQGYAIFDVNNTRQVSSGFNDWGCLPLMSAYIKAWEYIKEKYNVSDKLYLLSASMGTPVALNMMKWYKGDIFASLILAPRPLSAKGRWDNTYGEITDARIKEVLVAWGFEPDTILNDETYVVPSKESVFTAEVDAKLRGFYHYENMVTINGTDYIFEKFPPTKVMVGTNDTSFLAEVREYFSALQNFGNYINYREVAGQSHGAMCTLVNGDLRSEGLAWFERFRYV